MPLYEYTCRDCSREFEEMAPTDDDSNVRCPLCGSANVQRQISAVRCQSGTDSSQPIGGCAPSAGFS
ncbi:MAG: zinc ribbon domain-containing protein [Desulfohalobium sp.]